MRVVSSVEESTPTGSKSKTTYTYKNFGINVRRGLLGFEEITQTNELSNIKVRITYSQEYPYIGSVLKTKSYVNNILISESTTNYNHTSSNDSTISSPYISSSTTKEYDFDNTDTSDSTDSEEVVGPLLKTTTLINTTPDGFGNIASITNTIEDNVDNIWTTQTTNGYTNDTTNWHLSRLTRAEVTHSSLYASDITKLSSFTYNDDGLLESETIEPTSDTALTTTYEYDSFGNMISKSVDASDISERTISYTYSSDGKYNTTTTNILGHSESKTYDALGRVTSLTGPNGLTTLWEYDALNRKTKETRADVTTTQWGYSFDNSVSFTNGNKSLYKITTTKNNISNSTYVDAFDNKLRTTSVGFDGITIIEDKYYNALGQITKQSLPYYEGETAHFITSTYDDLGRLTGITKKNDSGADITATTSYDSYETTTTDFDGNSKTTTKNAKDKVIRVDEPLSAYLTHTHDSMGNLIQTDANGVTTTIEYDNRGNKIAMNDPSMGIWNYTYDSLGQLTSQTDAKGQTVSMEYDKLGRMVGRVEAEGITTWIYDTQDKGIGKLSRVSSPNLLKTYTYDALGRAHETTTHLNGEEYAITLGYDEYSRVTTKTHPGDFITENVYNDFGYLSAVRSPKEQITDYDWEHLQSLQEQYVENATSITAQVAQLEQKVIEYRTQANSYQELSLQNTQLATQLTQAVDALHDIADTLMQQAAKSKYAVDSWMNKYVQMSFLTIKRFSHLAQATTEDDQKRSYTDKSYDHLNMQIWYSGASHRNGGYGYAWCATKEKCLQAVTAATRSLRWTWVDIAQSYITQYTAAINIINEKTLQHKEAQQLATAYLDKSEEYVQKVIQHEQQLNALKQRVGNQVHYDDMLADTDNVYFWRAKSRDAANRLTGHLVGNGLSTENTYNPATGNLLTIESGFSANNNIRELSFIYDNNQNVLQRNNNALSVQMNYEYDVLDRLTSSYEQINSTSPFASAGSNGSNLTSYQYDIAGNILGKGNKQYTYESYQVTKVMQGDTTTHYEYDANGNMTRSGDKHIEYTSHNKPKRFALTTGTHTQTTQFLYDANRSRYQKIQNTYKGTTHSQIRTTYIGKSYEKIVEDNKIIHKYFIYNADGKLIATHSKEEDSNPFADTNATNTATVDKTNYFHYDNLGSIDTITDGQGNIIQQSEYKPFGQQTTLQNTASQPLLTNRGYTGHEHINEFGFIHMNGRVYDPSIGRFLSADPHIQAPLNSQSYNRYTYVLNNPLKYTDPSGYFFKKAFGWIKKAVKKLKKHMRTIVAIAVSFYAPSLGLSIYQAGFISGMISSGGDLKAGLISMASAGIANYIGHGASSFAESLRSNAFNKALAHGVSQGAMTKLRGGRFKDGFMGAIIAPTAGGLAKQGLNSAFDTTNVTMQKIIAITAGGIGAKATGGSFQSGAMSAAFVYLFNDSHTPPPGMTKNKDGHWQHPAAAANYAAGLPMSTASHGCGSAGIVMCQTVGAFFGYEDTSTTQIVDMTNQTLDTYSKVSGSWLNEIKQIKAVNYFINFGSRYNNAEQYCRDTCGKQIWEKPGYGSYGYGE